MIFKPVFSIFLPANLKFVAVIKKKKDVLTEKAIPNSMAAMNQTATPPAKNKLAPTNYKLAVAQNPFLLRKTNSISTANPTGASPTGAGTQFFAPQRLYHLVKTCSTTSPIGAGNQPHRGKPHGDRPHRGKQPKADGQKLTILLLLIMFLTSSCIKHPQLLNFRNQSEFVPLQGHEIANQLRIKIQTDDVLFIMVRALEQETAEPFNLFGGEAMQMNQLAVNNPSLTGYLVDPNGNIDLPVLGRLNVANKTIEETKALIGDKLKPYLNDPVIMIRFLNFRFTVLGEVKAPRTINVPGERMTILEALGQAGDLTPYSNREKIMVIREQDGKREFGYINIHSPEVFQSPYFYLQQNDIVYVEPIKEATALVRDPIYEVLPIISSLLSIVSIVLIITR